MIKSSEFPDDVSHGGCYDRIVHGGHQDAEQQAGKHDGQFVVVGCLCLQVLIHSF